MSNETGETMEEEKDTSAEETPEVSAEASNEATAEQPAGEQPQKTELELLQEEVASLRDEVLRGKAELENSRKRLQKQKQDELKYASLPLMRELLLVIDNLELALSYAPQDDPLREGVKMALDGMKKTLEQHNLKPVPAKGEVFDPVQHEAISIQCDPAQGDDVVLEEARAGYKLHDRVVRAAQVVVNRLPRTQEAQEDEGKESGQTIDLEV